MTPEQQPIPHSPKPANRLRPNRPAGLVRKKRKLRALLLAALFPGMGHIYLGLYRKGITFILVMMLDVSALLYFSSIVMQINVPLLILLGLLIPVAYFYNVYDVLQSAEIILSRRKREEAVQLSADGRDATHRRHKNPFRAEGGLSFGLLLVFGGLLLILFHQKPPWLQTGIRDYGAGITAAILMLLGVYLIVQESLRHRK